MRIALDYDGTYTADPMLWDRFIDHATQRGHEIVVVTMRRPDERVDVANLPVIYTSRKAKVPFMATRPERIDVWIDDNPNWLFEDSL